MGLVQGADGGSFPRTARWARRAVRLGAASRRDEPRAWSSLCSPVSPGYGTFPDVGEPRSCNDRSRCAVQEACSVRGLSDRADRHVPGQVVQLAGHQGPRRGLPEAGNPMHQELSGTYRRWSWSTGESRRRGSDQARSESASIATVNLVSDRSGRGLPQPASELLTDQQGS